ncbi:hypothetical protein TD95_000384 [Thielaviopsis punctulata]|uniref:3-phytase n=1 Tax=Thielaviopsis punctulata TaxID=72032 RepID=A0A0F4ZAI6_9PEZI|nr:hypothetical protein TD95_000384 [Thielaviopsis punctulata]
MTSISPPTPYSPTELAQLYPSSLSLLKVHVFLRHGERAIIKPRLEHLGHPQLWPYCTYSRHMRSIITHPTAAAATPAESDLHWQRKLHMLSATDDSHVPYPVPPNTLREDICGFGMLTDAGRASTYALGAHLRQLYVTSLGFLPPKLSTQTLLSLRSTDVPRALDSLQHTVSGLYPPAHRAPDLGPFEIRQAARGHETLFPNGDACPRLKQLMQAFAKRAELRWDSSPAADRVHAHIGKYMAASPNPGDSPRIGVNSKPSALGIMDSINATRANGTTAATRLPKEFYHPDVISALETAGLEEWFTMYADSAEARRLAAGPMLGDIAADLAHVAETPSRTTATAAAKIALNGCHDTTLGTMLYSLGASDGRWPPFTSHVAIELFRAASTPAAKPPPTGLLAQLGLVGGATRPIQRTPMAELSAAQKALLDGHYVRIRYNDRPVTVPGCRAEGKHLPGDETFCTLSAFKEIVDNMTPKQWKTECMMNLGAPAIPPKPEPAGF